MPRMHTRQDYSIVRFLAVVDAALAVLVLRIGPQIAPDAPNETFQRVASLKKWA